MHELLVPFNPKLRAELSNILLFSELVQGVVFLDQLARHSNVFSCLKLITSQHPDFDLCPLKIVNNLRYIVLQTIFDSCRAEKGQIALKLAVDGFKTLLFLVQDLFSLAQLKLEAVDLRMVEDFHCEVQCAQALLRRYFCETFDLVEDGLVLAI